MYPRCLACDETGVASPTMISCSSESIFQVFRFSPWGLRILNLRISALENSEPPVSRRWAPWRTRASGCTVAWLAPGGPCTTKPGGARLMITVDVTTCSSAFAHAHRGRDTCCSSDQSMAGPAGRRPLREAWTGAARSSAELLSSLRALDCASFVSQYRCCPKLTGCRAAQPERCQVQLEPHEARSGRPARPRGLAGASRWCGPSTCFPASCSGPKVVY